MSDPSWIHDGKEIEEPPEGYVGFVYIITLPDGRKYVGKKLWNFTRTKTIKGKRKKVVMESDWKTYYGSSDEVKKLVAELGGGKFKREILHLCKTKSELNYLETWEIFNRKCLLDESYVNGWVSVKINKRTVIGKISLERL